MSHLASALGDTLMRRLPPAATSDPALLLQASRALIAALEQGELGLDLEGEPPEGVEASSWPEATLQALTASGWMAEAEDLAGGPSQEAGSAIHAVIVRDGRWLRWRRWRT